MSNVDEAAEYYVNVFGGERTADDIAIALGLTRSAIRVQLAAMERDGVVEGWYEEGDDATVLCLRAHI